MKSAIVPSPLLLALLALLASLAVLVAAAAPAAWLLVPSVALLLLAMVVLDGWLAGGLVDLQLTAPQDAEIGQQARVFCHAVLDRRALRGSPEAALAFDARLGEGGVREFALSPTGAAGVFGGETRLCPIRRGTAPLDELALRWRGPLGLARRQARLSLEGRQLRVWPDLAPVRAPQLQAFLRDSVFGFVARRLRGEGSQFEGLSDFEPGMDRRRIDWKASARHTALYARENEAERDNQIVLALDCGQAMCEPVDGLPRIDRCVSAALMAAFVALKGGDRVALFGFADRPLAMSPFVTDTHAFHRLQQTAAGFDYVAREPNFTLALATLSARLRRRSLIVLFSDFADPTSAELMIESVGRLIRHHLVIFVTLQDTQLRDLTEAEPDSIGAIAACVAADQLARQRALVLHRLRRLGVEVIEAPWQTIGFGLIDRYLEARRMEAIG